MRLCNNCKRMYALDSEAMCPYCASVNTMVLKKSRPQYETSAKARAAVQSHQAETPQAVHNDDPPYRPNYRPRRPRNPVPGGARAWFIVRLSLAFAAAMIYTILLIDFELEIWTFFFSAACSATTGVMYILFQNNMRRTFFLTGAISWAVAGTFDIITWGLIGIIFMMLYAMMCAIDCLVIKDQWRNMPN